MAYKREPIDWSYLNEMQPLYLLKKKRAKSIVEVYVDAEDPWFLYFATRESKSRKLTDVSIIIRKDLPTWLSNFASTGWVAEKLYEEQNQQEWNSFLE